MKIAIAAALLALIPPAASAQSSDDSPVYVQVYYHVCSAKFSESECSCSLLRITGRFDAGEVEAELTKHGADFFARSRLANYALGALQECSAYKDPSQPREGIAD